MGYPRIIAFGMVSFSMALLTWSGTGLAANRAAANLQSLLNNRAATPTTPTDPTGGLNPSTLNSNQFVRMPPNFSNIAGSMTLSSIFSSCLNLQGNLANGIQSTANILKGKPDAAANALQSIQYDPNNPTGMGMGASACMGPDTPQGADNVSCQDITYNGVVNMDLLMKREKAIDGVIATINCKQRQIQSIQSELSCLRNQGQVLNAQIQAIGQAVSANIQQMQTQMTQLGAAQNERKAQSDQVNVLLNGDQGNGTSAGNPDGNPGLNALLKETTDSLAEMSQGGTATQAQGGGAPASHGTIQDVVDETAKFHANQKALTEMVQQREVALTMQCFTQRPNPAFQCVPPDYDVNTQGQPLCGGNVGANTAQSYISCRYCQNLHLGTNGQIELDTNTTNSASAKQGNLNGVLSNMVSDAPSATSIPSDLTQAQNTANQPLRVLSLADVETNYGDQLAGFNIAGLNVHDVVLRALSDCDNSYAKAQVGREENTLTSAIGYAQHNLQTEQSQLQNQTNFLINKYSTLFAKDMGGLTGQHLPVNTSACGKSQDVAVNCLKDLQTNLQGMLDGSTPQSTVNMVIKGANPQFNIPVNCQGLSGCVRNLSNVSTNLTQVRQQMTNYRQTYVNMAWSSTQAFFNSMGQAFSRSNDQLYMMQSQINSQLQSLGISGVNFGQVSPQDIQREDGDPTQDPPTNPLAGLPKMPTGGGQNAGGGLLAAISAHTAQPILNVANGDPNATQSIADGIQQFNDKMAQAQNAKTTLDSLKTSCRNASLSQFAQNVSTKVDAINSDGCGGIPQWCTDQKGTDQLNQLIAEMGEIQGDQTITDAAQSLSDGTLHNCLVGTNDTSLKAGSPCAGALSGLRNSIKTYQNAFKNSSGSATSQD